MAKIYFVGPAKDIATVNTCNFQEKHASLVSLKHGRVNHQRQPHWTRGFKSIWSNADKQANRERASGGLLMLIKEELTTNIIDINKHWIISQAKHQLHNIILGLLYFKTGLELEETLDQLQIIIDRCVHTHPGTPIVLGSDLNSRLGNEDGGFPPETLNRTNLLIARSSQDLVINKQGLDILNFMTDNGFFLLNGRTPEDNEGKITFVGPRGTSVIDLVWTNYEGARNIKTLQVEDDSCGSDHLPMKVELSLNFNQCQVSKTESRIALRKLK